jgi:membrane-associated phospholipid phosphatase
MHPVLRRLETSDLIVFGYGAVTLVLILLFFPRIPDAGEVLAAHLAVAALVAVLIACAARFPGRGWRMARDWYPLLVIPLAFRELHHLVHAVNPVDWDLTLAGWDQVLFGAHPTVALEPLLHPLAVEVLQLCYTSYYFLPVVLGVGLLRAGRRDAFRESLALIAAAFFTSYLGYFLVPARSPYFHEAALGHTRLWGQDPATLGYGLAPAIRATLEALELEMRDCFPSGHTEVTLVTLICAWRHHRPVFRGLLGPSAGLIAATVYLRYHYTVDVLAGAALAIAVAWAGPRLHGRWERRKKEWEKGGSGEREIRKTRT